jgi:hypothetical protein
MSRRRAVVVAFGEARLAAWSRRRGLAFAAALALAASFRRLSRSPSLPVLAPVLVAPGGAPARSGSRLEDAAPAARAQEAQRGRRREGHPQVGRELLDALAGGDAS